MQPYTRVALVTGAAQGLGKLFSEALLQRGTKVCLADVQESKGRQVENDFQSRYGKDNVAFVHCDVSSDKSLRDSFQTAVTKFGHIDLMVNNAGIADETRMKDMVNINLVGAMTGSMLAIEHMRKDKGGKGGKIINVASTAGLTGVFFIPLYCAVKFGVVGFHRSWSTNPHLGEMGIQFGCLCPAFTDTAIMELDEKRVLYFEEALNLIKKVGTNKVETVVQAFLQLVESGNCNGDIITVTATNGITYKQKGTRSRM
uniref:15-hydroxyprostaglandin dehydrogenase [NAD(+)] n=2 Tax=Arion vulgaris TaxID=1028688 RepID=A0A0B7A9R7_9EUPU